MKEYFENRRLKGKMNVACKFDDGTIRYWDTTKEEVVSHIVQIVRQYQADGYVLTLRQLHYQLVTQNWTVNHDSAYKKLGNILDDCRYSGVIDWDAIEDRGRVPYLPYQVEDVDDALNDTIEQYRLDRQKGQKEMIELWTEKDALSGILRRSTNKYHVRLVVNKGYTSSSAIYRAYQRVLKAIKNNQSFTILYFGDHDPSGLDMVRDIKDRLLFFLSRGQTMQESESVNAWWDKNKYTIYDLVDEGYCEDSVLKILSEEDDKEVENFYAGQIKKYLQDNDKFKVVPIGLSMDQIKKYNLPPNPTKLTDSRANEYIKKYGKTCWEVDALKPQTLTSIVEDNILKRIDINTFSSMIDAEKSDIDKLKSFIKTK